MADRLPHTMRAVRLTAYGVPATFEVREVPVPEPGPGEVLVKVAAAPIHLDDVVFCRGGTGFSRALPTTPGTEGAGLVVATGSGLVPRFLQDRRVAFAPAEDTDGTWAEYAVADASRCVPLWDDVDDETASMLVVDPITAIALLDEVKAHGHRGIVQTAPLGPIGRMILALAPQWGLPVVHVVDGAADVAEVRALGGGSIVDAGASDALAQLRRAVASVGATAIVDGLGGPRVGRLLTALPDGAEAICYAIEPGVSVEVDLAQLVWHRKSVRGLAFVDRARQGGLRSVMAQLPRIRRFAAEAFRQPIARRITLDELPEAVGAYQRRRGGRTVALPGPAA